MPIEITIPGSKSITNRVLALSYLYNKKIKLKNAAVCDDTKYMIEGIKKLNSKNKKIKIHTGDAGTATRFLTALAALSDKTVEITTSKHMQKRPMEPLIKALSKLKKNKGGKITIPGNISSQFISALLLIAPFTEKKTTIKVQGKITSKPYMKMTSELIKQFKNKKLEQFEIESDATSASYIGAYAALHPQKTVLLKNIYKNSIQGDIKFLYYLKKMGCKITHTKKGTKIQGPKQLKSLKTVDMNDTPDLVPTFTVLAMFTPGTTKFTNIANLKIKESDRIKVLKNEIKKFKNKKITINPHNDHRIAMAFGIIQDLIPNLTIQNKKCVSKSYPNFWKDIKLLQA